MDINRLFLEIKNHSFHQFTFFKNIKIKKISKKTHQLHSLQIIAQLGRIHLSIQFINRITDLIKGIFLLPIPSFIPDRFLKPGFFLVDSLLKKIDIQHRGERRHQIEFFNLLFCVLNLRVEIFLQKHRVLIIDGLLVYSLNRMLGNFVKRSNLAVSLNTLFHLFTIY